MQYFSFPAINYFWIIKKKKKKKKKKKEPSTFLCYVILVKYVSHPRTVIDFITGYQLFSFFFFKNLTHYKNKIKGKESWKKYVYKKEKLKNNIYRNLISARHNSQKKKKKKIIQYTKIINKKVCSAKQSNFICKNQTTMDKKSMYTHTKRRKNDCVRVCMYVLKWHREMDRIKSLFLDRSKD